MNDKSYFWAQNVVTGDEVLRSKDTFQARDVTETRAYPADDRRTHAVANELTQHLKDEGWEPLETSGNDSVERAVWAQECRLGAVRRGAYGGLQGEKFTVQPLRFARRLPRVSPQSGQAMVARPTNNYGHPVQHFGVLCGRVKQTTLTVATFRFAAKEQTAVSGPTV